MSNHDEPPACLTCGACCFSRLERYVRVSGDDYARLGDAAEGLTVFIENRCYMRMCDGHCAALALTSEGQFVCRIYDQRPEVCRDLERGGPACEAERLQKAARAEDALVELRPRATAGSVARERAEQQRAEHHEHQVERE